MTAELHAPPSPTATVDGQRPDLSAAGRLVRRATIVATLTDVALMAIIQQVIPPLALFAVATGVALIVLRQRPRQQLITLGVIALVANAAGVPFWSADVQHPADTVAFMWSVLSVGGRFVALAAAVLALRAPTSERAPRLLGTAAIGLLALAVVGTVTARATLTSEDQQTGDVAVAVEAAAFPDAVTVDSGETLFVDNRDPFRHTFTVEGTDVDVPLAPTVARRVPVDLAPGSYQIICTVPGHESMSAALEVAP